MCFSYITSETHNIMTLHVHIHANTYFYSVKNFNLNVAKKNTKVKNTMMVMTDL